MGMGMGRTKPEIPQTIVARKMNASIKSFILLLADESIAQMVYSGSGWVNRLSTNDENPETTGEYMIQVSCISVPTADIVGTGKQYFFRTDLRDEVNYYFLLHTNHEAFARVKIIIYCIVCSVLYIGNGLIFVDGRYI